MKAELRPKSRSLAKFATTQAALKFVEQLYSAGAVAVTIAAISAGQRKKLFADWLLIQLPRSKIKTEFPAENLSGVLPETRRGSSAGI